MLKSAIDVAARLIGSNKPNCGETWREPSFRSNGNSFLRFPKRLPQRPREQSMTNAKPPTIYADAIIEAQLIHGNVRIVLGIQKLDETKQPPALSSEPILTVVIPLENAAFGLELLGKDVSKWMSPKDTAINQPKTKASRHNGGRTRQFDNFGRG